MLVYLLRRLAGAVLAVLMVAAITWMLVHGTRPEEFAFDPRPTFEQFREYMEAFLLHGDLGISWEQGTHTVRERVMDGLPQDVQLLAGGSLLALAIGLPGGIFCARRAGAPSARLLETVAFVFLCTPVYVVGLGLVLLFGSGVGVVVDLGALLPAKYVPFGESPVRWLGSMLGPWLVLALPLAAFVLRMTSAVMRETLTENYIRTAHMKGVRERDVFRRHALPATLSPVFSLTAAGVPLVVMNMVLVERVFSIPGVFEAMPAALDDGNLPLLQGMAIALAALVAAMSVALDLVLAAIDPRVAVVAPRPSS